MRLILTAPYPQIDALKAAYREVWRARMRLEAAQYAYNTLLANALIEIDADVGEGLDVWGDGSLKLGRDCKPPPGAA